MMGVLRQNSITGAATRCIDFYFTSSLPVTISNEKNRSISHIHSNKLLMLIIKP